jgi:hypothetical protein
VGWCTTAHLRTKETMSTAIVAAQCPLSILVIGSTLSG